MEFNRITQKTEAETVLSDAHVLITQPEVVSGVATESLRRAPLDVFIAGALEVMGLAVVDGALCAILDEE